MEGGRERWLEGQRAQHQSGPPHIQLTAPPRRPGHPPADVPGACQVQEGQSPQHCGQQQEAGHCNACQEGAVPGGQGRKEHRILNKTVHAHQGYPHCKVTKGADSGAKLPPALTGSPRAGYVTCLCLGTLTCEMEVTEPTHIRALKIAGRITHRCAKSSKTDCSWESNCTTVSVTESHPFQIRDFTYT